MSYGGMMNRQVDVANIGIAHAGLDVFKEVRKTTDNYVLIISLVSRFDSAKTTDPISGDFEYRCA